MITKILNNYYNNLYKRVLEHEILSRFNLDIKFEESKNGKCCLYLKPEKYKNYTKIIEWYKGDSLNHLINLQRVELNYIIKRITNINVDDWN